MHARGGHIWFTCVNFFHCKLLHLMTTVIKIPKHILYRYNLGKISMPRIVKHLRKRAVGMLEAGASMEDVAAQVGSSVLAVRSLRWRFVQTGSMEDLPRSGRPSVTKCDHAGARPLYFEPTFTKLFLKCNSYSVCHPRYS